MEFPFYDSPDTAAVVCCHVLNEEAPVLYVSHDADDGMWQFLCGKAHETSEARVVSLAEAFEADNSVGELKNMPCGYYAVKKRLTGKWKIKHF